MTDKLVKDVSIVVANYNNSNYISDFIDSIIHSSVMPKQLIIIDDHSTDDSKTILKNFEHFEWIEIYYFSENQGFANALNFGIKKTTAKYIMRADPDDIVHHDKILLQTEFLENNPEICGVGCNVQYFHSVSNKILNKSNFPLSTHSINAAYKKGEHGLQHPTVMIHSNLFKQFEYRQEEVPAEDYGIFSKMILKGYKFSNIKETLYKIRIHANSSSSRINYQTIKKTYALRDQLFGTKTSVFNKFCYYLYIKNYRQYLLKQHILLKMYHLSAAILFKPIKYLKRIF